MEIDIDLSAQRLRLCDGEHQVMDVAVSTGANGIGEQNGSGCTPRGRHQVRAKIGQGAPPGAVFRGRRWTGEVWTPEDLSHYVTDPNRYVQERTGDKKLRTKMTFKLAKKQADVVAYLRQNSPAAPAN